MGAQSLALSFEYGDTPPSFNKVGHTGNRWAWTRAEKRWRKIFEDCLQATGMPRNWDFIAASAELRFPERRSRDAINYRVPLEKALGDALVNGRWLSDDTPDHFVFGLVTFDPEPGAKRTLIRLEAK